MPLDQKMSHIPSILFLSSPVIICSLSFIVLRRSALSHFSSSCRFKMGAAMTDHKKLLFIVDAEMHPELRVAFAAFPFNMRGNVDCFPVVGSLAQFLQRGVILVMLDSWKANS